MRFVAIVLWCVLAAIGYGIVHDQITVRICVEYFTIGHPRLIDSESPTVLGLFWGVVATWWAGLIMGVILAGAARWGRAPKWSVARLVKPTLKLLAVMAVCAFIAGLIGMVAARSGAVILIPPLADRIPTEKHVAFLTDAWAHSASYIVGGIGGIALAVHVWRSRRREMRT